eukprot:5886021-Prymnesium_polylepis.1
MRHRQHRSHFSTQGEVSWSAPIVTAVIAGHSYVDADVGGGTSVPPVLPLQSSTSPDGRRPPACSDLTGRRAV